MAAKMKYLFGFPAIYGNTPPIYVYISAVERLTLDAEQNDLQHVFREARMVTENLFKGNPDACRPGHRACIYIRTIVLDYSDTRET